MAALLSVFGNEVQVPASGVDSIHIVGEINTYQRAFNIIKEDIPLWGTGALRMQL